MVPRSKPPLTVRVCGCTGRQKEAMKLFEGSVKMAEAKLRSVEKKVKVELGQMRAAAHRSDAVFQQKLQQKRMLDALAEACYEKNLELLAMKETKARAIDLVRGSHVCAGDLWALNWTCVCGIARPGGTRTTSSSSVRRWMKSWRPTTTSWRRSSSSVC